MSQEELQAELKRAFAQLEQDPQAAQLAAEKALLLSSQNGWLAPLAFANLIIGDASRLQHSFDKALMHLQRANTLYKDLAEAEQVAHAYYAMGIVYTHIGEFSIAIDQLRKALSWLNRLEQRPALALTIVVQLANALMNLGYWSDAEQELLNIAKAMEFDKTELIDYQLMLLRLAFYRGDQRSCKNQLQHCRNLLTGSERDHYQLALTYFSARYGARYEHLRTSEAELSALWPQVKSTDKNMYFNIFEAAGDLLQSDHPQKGVNWLNTLLEDTGCPLELQRQIHLALAEFYSAHLSHQLATDHYRRAERCSRAVRDAEINHQWALYRADESLHDLHSQISQHKKNNRILAESNALLQAVNRIAIRVNSAADHETLLRHLHEHLADWFEAETLAIAELQDDQLRFACLLSEGRRLKPATLELSDANEWPVRAIKEGKLVYDNALADTSTAIVAQTSGVVNAIACVPLKIDNRVIGALILQSQRKNCFDARSISLLEYIAPVLAIAFVNLLNLAQTQRLSGKLSEQQQELNDVRHLMAHLSDHDELTGLPNRASLSNHFKQWVLQAPFHCLALRLNNLDDINSQIGFGSEDEIIKVISQRLRNRLRPDDLLVRVNNDQFVLFIEYMKTRDNLVEFTEQLLQLAEQPLRAQNQTVGANLAIGIVLYPEHGESLEEIMSMLSVAVGHASEDNSSIFVVE